MLGRAAFLLMAIICLTIEFQSVSSCVSSNDEATADTTTTGTTTAGTTTTDTTTAGTTTTDTTTAGTTTTDTTTTDTTTAGTTTTDTTTAGTTTTDTTTIGATTTGAIYETTASIDGHTLDINVMVLDPLDKDKLATGSNDKSIIFWGISSGALSKVHTITDAHTDRIVSLAYHNNNSPYLASGSIVADGIKLWDTDSYILAKTLAVHTAGTFIFTLAFDPINKGILASGSDDRLIILSDFNAGAPFIVSTFPECATASCSIKMIVFEYTGLMASNEHNGNIVIWETDKTAKFSISTTFLVYAMAFSPLANNRILASSTQNLKIKLWDPTTGLQIGSDLTGHTTIVNTLAFRSDGFMASGAQNNKIRVWEMTTKTTIKTLSPATSSTTKVMALGFNSDNVLVASTSDRKVRIWL